MTPHRTAKPRRVGTASSLFTTVAWGPVILPTSLVSTVGCLILSLQPFHDGSIKIQARKVRLIVYMTYWSQEAYKWQLFLLFSCQVVSDSFVTPVTPQVPLSMGFSRQEYWSGLPFPSPGDRPDPRIKPASLASPVLAGRCLTTELSAKPYKWWSLNWIQI